MAYTELTKKDWEADAFPGLEYPDTLPSCGEACHRCMFRYEMDNIGFAPTCDLTYDLQLLKASSRGLFDDMSQRQIDDTNIENDPVLWAHIELNWDARWYQKELLRCSSRRKAIRMGRRSGKTATLGVAALWFALNRIDAQSNSNRYEVLIVTPADVQLQRIWRDITTFIDYNPRIKAKETRRVKDPVRTLEFDNGSIIQLMVATSNVRGQDANAIFVDEADYCDADFVASLYPIVLTHPNVYLWVSSTPTGFKTKFWEYCTKKSIGFKEYHFPSYVIPDYSPGVEYEFRQIFTDIEYDHEILAEFGEAATGVFKKEHIAECFKRYNYSYKDCSYFNTKGYYRVMGIDWNDQAGIHVVICEFDTDWQAIKLVHKSIITHKDLVYHKAIRRILQLQRAWKCNHIYVDKGAGKMAMEALLLEGRANEHTGLDKIVKGVDFGSRMSVRIPGTNEFEKKAVKPLVVNMAVRRLQEVKIALPVEEKPNTGISEDGLKVYSLATQMEEFRVERITPSGMPVYSQGEEHTLIAWMCAVFGFVIECTTILNDSNKAMFDITVSYGLSGGVAAGQARAAQYNNILKQAAASRDVQLEANRQISEPVNVLFGKVHQERDPNGNLPTRINPRAAFLIRRSNVPTRDQIAFRTKGRTTGGSGRSNI